MVWLIEGNDGIEKTIDPDRWRYKLFSSVEGFSPSEATLTVPRVVPVKLHDWIRAVDGGKTVFLGYVSRQPSLTTNGRKSISALGAEALLMNCPCPLQSYFAGNVLLSQVFGSDDPDTSAHVYDIPGLIFAANSLIPPGIREDTLPAVTTDDWIAHGPAEIVDYNNAIVKYPNMGTRSRAGNAAIFVNGYPYSDKASYALMAAGSVAVWRDEEDLYLRHWLSGAAIPGWMNAPVFAKNAYDTRCRFGGIDVDSALEVQLMVDPRITVGDVFFNLAKSTGQSLSIEYDGKTCYVYVVEDFDPLEETSISSDDCLEVKYQDLGLEPDALMALGHGGNKTRQMQSIFSTAPGGAYLRATGDFPYTFFDKNQDLIRFDGTYIVTFTPTVHHGMLFDRAVAEWTETRESPRIELSIPSRFNPKVNSKINLDGTLYDVSSSEESDGEGRVIWLGKPQNTINDALKAKRDIISAYQTVENDFGIVAELTDTSYMVDLTYHANFPNFPIITYTNYITTWSTWVNQNAWGYPETKIPPIVSYGYEYYRDNNVRLLMSLKCEPDQYMSRSPFDAGKCDVSILSRYSFEVGGYSRPGCFLRINPLDEEIVDWDVTPYVPYGGSNNYFGLNVVIHSTDLITCYKEYQPYPKYNFNSHLKATLTFKLVQLGYSAKRIQMRVEKSRCGGLTLQVV